MWKHKKPEVVNIDSSKNRLLRKDYLLKSRCIPTPSLPTLDHVKSLEKFHIEYMYNPLGKSKPKSLSVSKSAIFRPSTALSSVRSKNNEESMYTKERNAYLIDRSKSFIISSNPNINHNSKQHAQPIRPQTSTNKRFIMENKKTNLQTIPNKLSFKIDVKVRKPIFSHVNKQNYEKFIRNDGLVINTSNNWGNLFD